MRQQIYITQIDSGDMEDLEQNKNFIENMQTAVLLSLLKKGQLTKRQFDLCIEKLKQ